MTSARRSMPRRRVRSKFSPARLQLRALEERIAPAANYLPPSYTLVNTGALSAIGPNRNVPPLTAALNYLNAHTAALGMTPADLIDPVVTSQYTDTDSGITHIYLRQTFDDLPVAYADMNVSVLANGEVFTVAGGFVNDLADKVHLPAANTIMSALDALVDGATALGLTLRDSPTLVTPVNSLGAFVIAAPSISLDPIPARLQYVPTEDGSAALAWNIVLRLPGGQHWYDTHIDAVTGELLAQSDWIDNDAFEMVPPPNESPQDGGFAVKTAPADPIASPFGWNDTNGVAGAEFTDTRGNNVDAHLDRNDDDTADAGSRPSGGANLDFSTYTFDSSSNPLTTQNQNAAVVNLFTAINLLHDVHYKYGFTEAAGNFQVNNYGKGGLANDAVQADAQDGSGINNANFSSPADGTAPRMQQYVWTFLSTGRDSDLDNGVIFHEFGHGVSNRLTGGAANANALNATQSGGMGEGWSDFYAMMFTQTSASTQNGGYGMATYVANQAQNGVGIRRFQYSYNMTIDPLTFDAYGASGTTSYGVTRSTEVHNTGEIWCSTLWDLNWLLINKYGYDAVVSTGYSASAGPAHAGNKLVLKLVMDAMKLQSANPSFIQARDAIINADNALNGGADLFEIWSAFARRGLGQNAVDASSSTTTITAGFTVPAGLPNFSVTTVTPANASAFASTPINYVVFTNAAINAASIQASDLTVNGNAAASFSYNPGDSSITFTFATDPVTTQGLQTISMATGAITRASDSQAVFSFTSYFRYDTTTLAVASTSPAVGAVATMPFTTLDINFNEAVDPATVSISDLWVSQGYVTGVTMMNSNQTARFTLANVPEGAWTATLNASAIADVFGNPNPAAFTGSYTADVATLAFPTPLTSLGAAGNRIYQGSFSGTIYNNLDLDDLTIALDAGQTLTLVMAPGTGLRPRVQLISPLSVTIADVTAAATNQAAVVSSTVISTPGTYTIRLSSASGTTGSYTIKATLNATVENESNAGGSGNNNAGAAQSLNGAMQVLTTTVGSTSRAGVYGTVDSFGSYTATTPAFAFEDISATGATILTNADDVSSSLSLPFAFNFYGINYTSLYVSDNGNLAFNMANDLFSNSSLNFNPGQPIIAAFWDDLATNSSGVKWQVLGSVGARRMIIQWQNVKFTASGGTNTVQFETILYEGTNQIRFNYANLTGGSASHNEGLSATVGIKDDKGNRTLLAQNNGPNTYVGSNKSTLLTPTLASPDWYSFTMSAGQVVSLVVAASTTGTFGVQLYASDGSTLLATGASSSNFGAAVENFPIASGGTYYALVTGDSQRSYNLTVLKDAIFDAEPNNSAATAQPLAATLAAHGQISSSNADWYSVTMPAGTTSLVVETATPGDGVGEFVNTLDPAIQLYDFSATIVIANGTVQADGRNEIFVATDLTPGATYFVRVFAGGATSGEYLLGAAPVNGIIAAIVGNDLLVTDGNGSGTVANNWALSFDGTNYTVTDTADQFVTTPTGGALSGGNKTLTIPVSAFSGKVIFNGNGGSDTLTVDWSTGNFARDIDFNGGSGTSDQLVTKGGNFSSTTVQYTNAHDGAIVMTPVASAARTISYTGLEPVDLRGSTIADLIFNLPATASDTLLEDDATPANGTSQIRSANGTFELTSFADPSNSLMINRGNAADSMTVSALPDFDRTLTIGSASVPFSTVALAGAITLGSGYGLNASASASLSLTGNIIVGGNLMLNSGGPITQTLGFVQVATGSLTINAVGQTATFGSLGNKAGSLVIPSGVNCIVNGSFDSAGAVQVDGTLGGSGSVGTTTVTGTGKVAPGNSPGQLTTGNIAFNSGSVFSVELNGPNVGSDYDQLVVNGTVNLGGATLSPSLGYSPASNQVFKIIDNDGTGDAVTGTFNGYIEGATVVIGGVNFTISYQGGDGNDVTLTRQAAAPPPTVASVLLDEGSGNANIGGVDGTAQRSEVRRIVVTFSEAVNFTGGVAGAFSLSRSGTSSSSGSAGPVGLVANPTNGPASSVTITFTGGFADSTGSLVDGLYNFSIDAQQVSGAGGKLNGSGAGAGTDYTVTGTTANKWFRYYGDQNGDGTVDQTDYLVFRNALAGGPSSVFDYQNSLDVDQTDYLEFRNRLAGAP
ncbi:MAG: M36 family metallopeptidase [Gemmataceae bacterium]